MASQAFELTASATVPHRIDLSGAYLAVIEIASDDARISFTPDGFTSTSSYRTMVVGSSLALDLPRPPSLSIWVRGDSSTTVARVLVFR